MSTPQTPTRPPPTPDNTYALQDLGGMAVWAALDSGLARGAPPEPMTLLGAAVGALAWQYYGKQMAAKQYAAITGGELGDDLVAAVSGEGLGAFSNVSSALEDNLALATLSRPGTYLVALAAVGTISGKKLTLPDYLVIAAGGAGFGSIIRASGA